ncbi:MAG: hypothetical protein JWL77_4150 [Chthonomonadaceae bacterium]|nr:hypothetical protein [Chthonomonadaceae bacterium]
MVRSGLDLDRRQSARREAVLGRCLGVVNCSVCLSEKIAIEDG